MASAAPSQALPLLYKDIIPLSSEQHAGLKLRKRDKLPFLADVHAVPVTVDEFTMVQRFMPIVFSTGDNPVPLALMGLNPGVNVFIDKDGTPLEKNVYLPAYVRRYPFMLARLREESDELSLCFDPSSDAVGEFDEGDGLFDGGNATPVTNDILKFCEQVETSGHRTGQFIDELKKAGLLMDGEVAIQPEGADKPFIYRGFQMVNEEKLKELRGDQARKFVQNGILALVYMHIISLGLVREIFARQLQQGAVPPQPDAQVQDAQIPEPSA